MAKHSLSFTDLLVQKGLVSPNQISAAADAASEDHISLQDAIIKLKFAKSADVMKALADSQGYEYIYLEDLNIPPNIIEMVPESVARENAIIPLSADESALTIVTSKPEDFELSDKLQFILNRRIKFVVASKEAIIDAIDRHYGSTGGDNAKAMLQEFTDTQIDFTETDEDEEDSGSPEDPDSPVVKLVHLIISEAVQARASDIHIEPFEDRVRIRYRIDGVLVERNSPPRRMLGAILSRIKILSKLDIAERRRTQDGRIKVTLGEKEL
ncbi:MAG: Flp pilus assembly complex ATPase component TadA, partial [Thermoguttaceae bacterium]|nr:Flp pilus assembly complex ATPase component TadA [Thermoguttaceae bacterium]